ncbi:hypothetical protein SDC9_195666 [bioreactor metagenome]|uniref:Uncharacterized protein n=1 Tax=bioreactor metagenome TaxID=1076179 RepID=A0A645IB63_9ZZZZ
MLLFKVGQLQQGGLSDEIGQVLVNLSHNNTSVKY